MLPFFKKAKINNVATSDQAAPIQPSFIAKLRQGLNKTRGQFTKKLLAIFTSNTINSATLELLESILIQADLGSDITNNVLSQLQTDKQLEMNPEAAIAILKNILLEILIPTEQNIDFQSINKPFLILMVGVNGSGKTTSIGKLAKYYKDLGKSVMLAAGDTFRAAASEQLQKWGQQEGVPVIAQHQGADSASVIFDAYQAAKAKGIDILIADTAGRLHTQGNLMQELEKITRVVKKIDISAPHETMLVLDAGTGQNAIQQAKAFKEKIGVSGLCITKLDGTAKGGAIFSIAKTLKIPIRYIGIGEASEDLKPFKATDFIEALFSDDQ